MNKHLNSFMAQISRISFNSVVESANYQSEGHSSDSCIRYSDFSEFSRAYIPTTSWKVIAPTPVIGIRTSLELLRSASSNEKILKTPKH